MDLVAFLSPAPCAHREERGRICVRRTGFLDRVSQPRSGADAHPAATVWDGRQVELERGLGQTLESPSWNFITSAGLF